MLIRALVFSLACCLSASLAQAQTLFGHYEFNGNLSNSATGGFASGFGTLEEINGSGSFATESGAWSWSGATAPGIGFRLPVTGLPADRHTFSLGLVFKVSDVGVGGNYRKIIDFSNGAHDDGLWLVNGKLIAYGALSATEEGNFTANQTISLVFTRNISDVINVYVNGSTTPLFTKTAFFPSQFRILNDSYVRFFLDNDGDEFSPAGTVYDLRIWDSVLTSGQISAYFAAVPEPSTYAALCGLLALGVTVWRRRAAAGRTQP